MQHANNTGSVYVWDTEPFPALCVVPGYVFGLQPCTRGAVGRWGQSGVREGWWLACGSGQAVLRPCFKMERGQGGAAAGARSVGVQYGLGVGKSQEGLREQGAERWTPLTWAKWPQAETLGK